MRLAIVVLVAMSATAGADVSDARPIVGFRMRGKTKVTERTAEYLSHAHLGDVVGPSNIAHLQEAFLSSELFETVAVSLEQAPGGYLVVATVKDKHSWIAAPTVFWLPGKRAFGAGFIENDLRGQNQKVLLYGQLGDHESLFFGAYLDPSVRGSALTARVDVLYFDRQYDEYANPVDAPTDDTITRSSHAKLLNIGALFGWHFRWWLTTDFRLRGAYIKYGASAAPDGTPMPVPEKDGYDVTAQWRLTLDARQYRYGVRWGPYAQLFTEKSIPGLDDFDYWLAYARAFYSWKLFEEHQLEVRGLGAIGKRMPFHEELTNGGVTDLRGYTLDRFRGDERATFRFEYSVPIVKWKYFAFRSIAFWDSGYITLASPRTTGDRDYLPTQYEGVHWWRNDVGLGVRIYVKAVVLPLLGLDVAYGVEAKSPKVTFQLGLTDF